MQNINLSLGFLNISCGLLFVLLGTPLVKKKVSPNSLYGFRTEKALASDENWYEINSYGGRQLIRWCSMLVFIGILYFIFPVQELQDTRVNILMAIAPILICPAVAIAKTILFSRQL